MAEAPTILVTPDPRLRNKSKKVVAGSSETKKIVEKMIKLARNWEKRHPHEISAAMAAPQMGIHKRVVIVREDQDDKEGNSWTALINPEVIRTEGKNIADYEGCLSVPMLYGMVERPQKVKLKAWTLDGAEVRIKAEGTLARILLHEIDHLDGILFVDRIKGKSDTLFNLDDKGELKPIPKDEVKKYEATIFGK